MSDIRTYRAESVADALRRVREELGPDAAVLQTRELGKSLWCWLAGSSGVEVVASGKAATNKRGRVPRAELFDYRARFRDELLLGTSQSVALEELSWQPMEEPGYDLPGLLDRMGRLLARQQLETATVLRWLQRLNEEANRELPAAWPALCQRLIELVSGELAVGPPLRLLPDRRRVVALVGPTGVGKTTTLAKLAASFRLRPGVRVGLITVDTYRIAAVTQVRTYAELMELPMEVVSSPSQMQQSLSKLADMDLLLIDTAGCSPRDDVQLGDLEALLAEARPDETLLVLSSVAALDSLVLAADTFMRAGATSLVLTKIDEAASLGPLLPLLENRRLPVSYVTDGQNVPHDLRQAERRRLAEFVVGRAIAWGASSVGGFSRSDAA